MKKALASVVAAGIFLGGAGTAFASSWHKLPDLKTRGTAFEQGFYRFNPAERNHGSFEWSGYLIDTDPADNHNGYVQVRVEGHDWTRYYGKQKQRVRLHHSNWDGAQRYADDAYFRVCLDKGTLRPDNCSSARHYQSRQG